MVSRSDGVGRDLAERHGHAPPIGGDDHRHEVALPAPANHGRSLAARSPGCPLVPLRPPMGPLPPDRPMLGSAAMSLRPASGEGRSRLVVVAVVAAVIVLTRIWLLAVPPTFSDIPAYEHDAALWGAAGEQGASFYDAASGLRHLDLRGPGP